MTIVCDVSTDISEFGADINFQHVIHDCRLLEFSVYGP